MSGQYNGHDRQDDAAQQRFLQQTRSVLNAAEQQLDGSTRTRLRAARREALVAIDKPRLPHWLMPASGLAVAVAVVALSVGLWPVSPSDSGVAALDDMALLSDESGPEFYVDLEFYRWVADGAPIAGGASMGNGRGEHNGAG